MSAAQIKKARVKIHVFIGFIGLIYIPFIVFLSFKYNIIAVSLSGIGWREGGLRYLFCYVLFTVPLMIYQTALFTSLSSCKSRLLSALVIAGGLLITAGAFFPVSEASPRYCHLLHNSLCPAGSLLCITAVTYMIALYCKNKKTRVKEVAVFYGALIAFTLISFYFLKTAALFEAGSSLLFLITMVGTNSVLLDNAESAQEINASGAA